MSELAVTLQRTPLHAAHLALGAKMAPFAGWEMPLHYGSQIEEHLATRRDVAIFDVSHMGQVEIVGSGTLNLAQALVTRDLATLDDGEAAYGLLCRADGGIIDDLIAARLGPERFFLVVNAAAHARDIEHMEAVTAALGPADAELRPCSDRWAMIAVQGPRWIPVVEAVIGPGPWGTLPPYRVHLLDFRATELILSTTGYTGEAGCELICAPEVAAALWEALLRAGARPAGLAARDTLRLEKGLCLSGQDFTEENNPFEARLGWVVQLEKPDFCGRESLARIKRQGVRRRLMGLLPEGRRIPRNGMKLWADGREVGGVTSGGYSPSLERPIALGYVAAPWAHEGAELDLDLGRGTVRAQVTRPPFYPPRISNVA